jgi:uncharacterized protein YjgD (DUF1641 family)
MSSVVIPKDSGHAAPAAPIKVELSQDLQKIDRILKEVGEMLPNDDKHSLLRYLYTVKRDEASAKKITEEFKNVDVNLIVDDNSALLIALNRYLGFEVTGALLKIGANGNQKTT